MKNTRTSVLLALGLVAGGIGAGIPVSAHAERQATALAATGLADAFAPTALTLHGGRANQEFGTVLNSDVCDLDGDSAGDVTATGAAAFGSTGGSFVDMEAQRRLDGYSDALTDLPQWTNWTTDGTTGFTCAGDVNADGFDDLVEVVAPTTRVIAVEQSAGTRNASGKLVQNRVRRYTFPTGSTHLGARALGGAGDVDGDGLGDVLVSQHTATPAATPAATGTGATRAEAGRLWVLRGKAEATFPSAVSTPTLTTSANAGADVALVVSGAAAGDRIGTAVSLGDVTGDGFDDLAVASERGTVWLVRGAAPTATTREVDLAASDGHVIATGATGLADLAVGDVDGDSRTDLVVGLGAGLGTGPAADGGVAVITDLADAALAATPVVVDPAAGTVSVSGTTHGYLVRAEHPGDALGHSVAVMGDLDGDGRDDLLVGAPGVDVPDASGRLVADTGAAYVLAGRAGGAVQELSDLTAAQGHRVDGTRGDAQADDRASRFGFDVAAVGDVDGNGAADFAVSAPGRSEHATYRQGAVTVALRGELGAQVSLKAARRVGDDGIAVADGTVLKASDVVDVRTNLLLATAQGISGRVTLTVDGAPVATGATTVSAPHRAFAFFDDVALPVGEHVLGVRTDAVAGVHGAATQAGPQVLVTDTTRTTVTVENGQLVARVVTATDGTSLTTGTVTFTTAGGETLAADVAVVEGVARVALPSGTVRAAATGARAAYSGVATRFRGEPAQLLAASTATVAAPVTPKGTLTLSTKSVRRGDVVRATLTLDRVVSDTVTLLVDGRAVGTAKVTGRTATVQLPKTLGVGSHTVTARTAGTQELLATTATAKLTVTRTTTGTVKATAKKFARGGKPKVVVTVAKASDGTWPVGKVTVKVGGVAKKVKVTAAKKGKVTVTLPARRTAGKATVSFTPTARGSYTTPKSTSVKLRPRG
ncbi:VCBS repeat-containing protein [Nocardioides yefusunii]|uniref:VCBS repeat-containing protein n=1 Tax=Nocardioides yefusunii TaxID=2500546 RepID=A0ABW1QVL8_9ACTN|nr:VCBS repeat-containing protein [Nocardioides yefusunii]